MDAGAPRRARLREHVRENAVRHRHHRVRGTARRPVVRHGRLGVGADAVERLGKIHHGGIGERGEHDRGRGVWKRKLRARRARDAACGGDFDGGGGDFDGWAVRARRGVFEGVRPERRRGEGGGVSDAWLYSGVVRVCVGAVFAGVFVRARNRQAAGVGRRDGAGVSSSAQRPLHPLARDGRRGRGVRVQRIGEHLARRANRVFHGVETRIQGRRRGGSGEARRVLAGMERERGVQSDGHRRVFTVGDTGRLREGRVVGERFGQGVRGMASESGRRVGGAVGVRRVERFRLQRLDRIGRLRVDARGARNRNGSRAPRDARDARRVRNDRRRRRPHRRCRLFRTQLLDPNLHRRRRRHSSGVAPHDGTRRIRLV